MSLAESIRDKVAAESETAARIGAAPRPERACRVCGCPDEQACETADGPCRWVDDGRGGNLCSACEAAKDHVVSMTQSDGRTHATCRLCGWTDSDRWTRAGFTALDARIRQHWRDVVASAA